MSENRGENRYRRLRSMTGQGRCEVKSDAGTLVTEIRSVNHRGLKVILRVNDLLSAHEVEIASLARERIERGTVTIQSVFKLPPGEELPKINLAALKSYASQLSEVSQSLAGVVQVDLAGLLDLPGVLTTPDDADRSVAADESILTSRRDLIHRGISDTLDRFDEMRQQEAAAMAVALETDLEIIRNRSQDVRELAPSVIARYRDRLLERVQKTLSAHNLENEPIDVIREVQLFADRGDISEELTRLSSHLDLFKKTVEGEPEQRSGDVRKNEAVGRKLDFIIQEMFRETNTIGSKAGNAEIAGHIVEMKCAIERMRELVQNLE